MVRQRERHASRINASQTANQRVSGRPSGTDDYSGCDGQSVVPFASAFRGARRPNAQGASKYRAWSQPAGELAAGAGID